MSEITGTELEVLQARLAAEPLQVDEHTFQPFKELDGRRFYIEVDGTMLDRTNSPSDNITD